MAADYESSQGDKPVRYLPGKNLVRKVVSKVHKFPAGYFVTTIKTGEHGFLQTTADLNVDAEVMGFFVCWTSGRSYMLLSHIAGKSK